MRDAGVADSALDVRRGVDGVVAAGVGGGAGAGSEQHGEGLQRVPDALQVFPPLLAHALSLCGCVFNVQTHVCMCACVHACVGACVVCMCACVHMYVCV